MAEAGSARLRLQRLQALRLHTLAAEIEDLSSRGVKDAHRPVASAPRPHCLRARHYHKRHVRTRHVRTRHVRKLLAIAPRPQDHP